MGMQLIGLNRIVNLIDTNFNVGEMGTATTIESRLDTQLGSVVTATQITCTSTTANKYLEKIYSLPATTGNGITYSEFMIASSTAAGGTAWNHVTFVPRAKTIGETWTVRTIFVVRERNR